MSLSAKTPGRYKPTNIGLIPKDWEVRNLGELLTIRHGKNQREIQVDNGRYPILATGGEIGRTNKPLYASPSVLIGRKGTIDQPQYMNAPFWTVDTLFYSEIKEDNCPKFLYYRFWLIPWQSLNAATGVPSLSARAIESVEIATPPFNEQHVIADALSDVDALLNALDRQIAKQRDLKKAAMQQLLTGRTRLPGYSATWKTKFIGEGLSVHHGKNQKNVESANGTYPILGSGGQIGTAVQPIYDQPSVLIGRKGTIDAPQYMDGPFWTVDTLFYTRMIAGDIAKFWYYRFWLIPWRRYNEASGVPSLNAKTIEGIEFPAPEPEEQSAIATALSDMDAEIAALEARRTKTAAIKQGMMQELLTGRIRLV